MKQKLNRFLSTACMMAIAIIALSGCKKDSSHNTIDYRDAPKKSVPAELVGDWQTVSVSSTNVEDDYGHSVPAWTFGATFHIDANGTGFEAITSSYTYVNSPTQQEDVNSDGTYVIENTGNNKYSFKYYPVSGKVYDNGVYKHNLTADKVWPNGAYNWSITLDEDDKGKYFDTDDARFYKK